MRVFGWLLIFGGLAGLVIREYRERSRIHRLLLALRKDQMATQADVDALTQQVEGLTAQQEQIGVSIGQLVTSTANIDKDVKELIRIVGEGGGIPANINIDALTNALNNLATRTTQVAQDAQNVADQLKTASDQFEPEG